MYFKCQSLYTHIPGDRYIQADHISILTCAHAIETLLKPDTVTRTRIYTHVHLYMRWRTYFIIIVYIYLYKYKRRYTYDVKSSSRVKTGVAANVEFCQTKMQFALQDDDKVIFCKVPMKCGIYIYMSMCVCM